MENKKAIKEISEGMVDTYERLPIVIEKGDGCWLYDVEGKDYLDMLSCYSAVNAGHCNPRIVKKIIEQVGKLDTISHAFFHTELDFATKLANFCEYDKALLMNSGAEAVERIIKIVRKWGYTQKNIPKNKAEIIVCKNNFHGRTYGVLSASSELHYTENFGPFLPGFIKIPFNDTEALKNAINKNTCAFLVEPIQAEAGILIPDDGYLAECKKICEEEKILFCLDEIQTGLGRTGKIFCWQHDNAKPDIMTIGKFLGGGQIPISAVLGNKGIVDIFDAGEDGSTYSGNPMACVIGKEVLNILNEQKLDVRTKKLGKYFIKELKKIKSPYIKKIRGKGLLIGIELEKSAGGARKFCEKLLEERLLCKETHENVIRLAPPLTIWQTEIDIAIKKIKKVLEINQK